MDNSELYRRTVEVLSELIGKVGDEDMALLCWHCGIRQDELKKEESCQTN